MHTSSLVLHLYATCHDIQVLAGPFQPSASAAEPLPLQADAPVDQGRPGRYDM